MSFSFNLELFRAIFSQKIRSKKLGKSMPNPLPKCQIFTKNGHFLRNFFPKEKRLQMA